MAHLHGQVVVRNLHVELGQDQAVEAVGVVECGSPGRRIVRSANRCRKPRRPGRRCRTAAVGLRRADEIQPCLVQLVLAAAIVRGDGPVEPVRRVPGVVGDALLDPAAHVDSRAFWKKHGCGSFQGFAGSAGPGDSSAAAATLFCCSWGGGGGAAPSCALSLGTKNRATTIAPMTNRATVTFNIIPPSWRVRLPRSAVRPLRQAPCSYRSISQFPLIRSNTETPNKP